MKKKIVLGLIVLLVLVGCSSGVKGTWELTKMAKGEEVIEGEELTNSYGGVITYEFKGDGILVVDMMGQTVEGTWKESDNNVTIEYNGMKSELKRDGKTMTLEQSGYVFTFTKK